LYLNSTKGGRGKCTFFLESGRAGVKRTVVMRDDAIMREWGRFLKAAGGGDAQGKREARHEERENKGVPSGKDMPCKGKQSKNGRKKEGKKKNPQLSQRKKGNASERKGETPQERLKNERVKLVRTAKAKNSLEEKRTS